MKERPNILLVCTDQQSSTAMSCAGHSDLQTPAMDSLAAEVGRLLTALQESGHDEDTLVLFTSDHGDGAGAHRWNQKTAFWEESIRIPLIARGPGVLRGQIEPRLVSTGIDLLPTLCEVAGIDAPDTDGRSLQPLLRGDQGGTWRNHVAVETSISLGDGPGGPAVGRALVCERTKYSVYAMGRNREQLVDLHQDPGEMVNLAVEARHADSLEKWRERLRAHCAQTEDQAGAELLP
jgi:arylsulfatase A-like enzyme